LRERFLGAFSPGGFFSDLGMFPDVLEGRRAYDFIIADERGRGRIRRITSNLRLGQLLMRLSGSAVNQPARLVRVAGGNLFLGSQLSGFLRPFIGAPGLPVQFYAAMPSAENFLRDFFSDPSRRCFFSMNTGPDSSTKDTYESTKTNALRQPSQPAGFHPTPLAPATDSAAPSQWHATGGRRARMRSSSRPSPESSGQSRPFYASRAA